MNVELISVTPDALDLLLRTKNTRLGFDSNPAAWSAAQRSEHLAYMRDTIKSSWAFVDYTFEISGVTRAFTHQLVRTGWVPFAQESQRTVDVRGHEVMRPQGLAERSPASLDLEALWDDNVKMALDAYGIMIDAGIPAGDARGILPTNMTTSIIGKFSLRTLHEMAKVRLCTRTQGEYQRVFRRMRELVIEVHPWVEEFQFLEVHCVSNGTCAFPRYGAKECKFWKPWMRVETLAAMQLREEFWGSAIQSANPVAKNGKAV